MNDKYSMVFCFIGICCFIVLCAPGSVHCEKWLEFHAEDWNYKSEKLNKKLKIRNVYYYDADNLARGKNGVVALWVKELATNDRYYVGKGVPEQETTYKNVRISCSSKRYEILTGDGSETEYSEEMSEKITSGSYYDSLQSIVCKEK